MTETPDEPSVESARRKAEDEELRRDDPPDFVVEKGEDGSLTYMSQETRAAQWTVAKTRAQEKGTDPRTEFSDMLLERRKATLGPNRTQEKARKLHEWWQSGCGGDPELMEMTQDVRTFDQLRNYEQRRWAVLAKALGDHPYHDHTPDSMTIKAEKYKNIPAGVSWADFDNVLHPEDAGYSDKYDGVKNYIHNDDPTYDEWVDQQPKARQHWWQLWRPVEVFTEYEHYCRFIRDQALLRKGPRDELIDGTIGDILRAASRSSR